MLCFRAIIIIIIIIICGVGSSSGTSSSSSSNSGGGGGGGSGGNGGKEVHKSAPQLARATKFCTGALNIWALSLKLSLLKSSVEF